ncbi:MAG: hypothetical protein ABI480_00405 [Chitinophagaceae bacterium]
MNKVCRAMVACAYYENDWKWAQEKFLTFLQNNDTTISGLAATCLGHIARIHHKIDKDKVLPALQNYIHKKEISGPVQDALDDIEIFVK